MLSASHFKADDRVVYLLTEDCEINSVFSVLKMNAMCVKSEYKPPSSPDLNFDPVNSPSVK